MFARATAILFVLALPFAAEAVSPGDGGACVAIPDAAGNLVCSLGGILPAPPSVSACLSMDLDMLAKKLKDTSALGLFTKLMLKGEVETLLTEARAMRTGAPDPGRAAALQRGFETLHGGLVNKLAADPPLATAISCNRQSLWNALLTK